VRRLALLGCLTGLAAAGPPPARFKELLAAPSLRFEPNLGQYPASVRFAARSGRVNLRLTAREAILRLAGENPATVRMSLPGSNPAPRIEGAGQLASRSHYFLGNRRENWRTGVAHYRSVRYAAVYPGVDLVYYSAGDGLEYDFLVRPGADPQQIRIRFRGAQRLTLSPQGDLQLRVGGLELTQRKPVAYQPPARPVECRYRLLGSDVAAFELVGYDPSLPLVIDPVLVYSSFLGAGAQDSIVGVKLDGAGMVYVVGYTDSGDLPAVPGSYKDASAGGRDIFIAKFNPALAGAESLVYFTYFGGSGADTPTAMTVDAVGSVYVTGSTTSTDLPTGGQGPQFSLGGTAGSDAFVVKLNPAIPGEYALLFGTYLGGSGTDIGYAIDVDAKGAIYVAGLTTSQDFPLAGHPVQAGLWGPQDGFVVKLSPAVGPPDSLVYSTYLGGEAIDECRAIAVAPTGLVFVAGSTFSGETFQVLGTAFQPAYGGAGDIFLTVLNLNRPGFDAVVYSTFLGGSSMDVVRKITPAPGGGVLLTGYTLSADFPITSDAFQPTPGGNGDVFLIQLDPSLAGEAGLVYSTFLGGSGSEVAYDLLADAQKNVYLTGYTFSADFPVTSDAFQPLYSGGMDVFCAKLNLGVPPAQALAYSTLAGRGGINIGYGIAVSPAGVIYLAGYSQDRAFPVTDNALQAAHGGGFSDGFILALTTP
jgi:hypothetical protein